MDSLGSLTLAVDVVDLSENALQSMDTLSNSCVDGVIVVDIHVHEGLHLQRVEVDVDRQQIKREVSDVDVFAQVVPLEELLADDGSFWPKTREVFFDSFVAIALD